MKKAYILLTAVCTMGFFLSCEDEDKDPWVIHEDPANNGTFVTIAKNTQVIDFTNPDSPYSFTVEAPGNNVASYDLMVSRVSGGTASDTVMVRSITSFPSEVNVTVADLASALGASPDDFAAGDRFNFIGSATGTDGATADFSNLNGDATGPGMFNAYRHNTFLSCPFVQADAVGTYETTVDDFGLAQATFEVTAGPTPNSVVISDLIVPGFSMVMEVDPDTGIGSIARTPMAPEYYGYSGGNINTTATPSFFFSCTGTISATLQYTVDLGSFGSYAFAATKQ